MPLGIDDLHSSLAELLHLEHASLVRQLEQQHETLLARLDYHLHKAAASDEVRSGKEPHPPEINELIVSQGSFESVAKERTDPNLQPWFGKQPRGSCSPLNTDPHSGAEEFVDARQERIPCAFDQAVPSEASTSHPMVHKTSTSGSQPLGNAKRLLRIRSSMPGFSEHDGDDGESDDIEQELADIDSGPTSAPKVSLATKKRRFVAQMSAICSCIQSERPNNPNQCVNFFALIRWRMRLIAANPKFELTFASLIVVNTMLMALMIQYNGHITGWNLQHPGAVDYGSARIESLFYYSEAILGFTFCLEIIWNVIAFGIFIYLKSIWGWLDGMTGVVWLMDFVDLLKFGLNPMILRLVRLARLLKMLRLVRTLRAFDTLHLLVFSIRAGVSTLVWSACVLILVKMCVAMVLSQLLEGFIKDSTQPQEMRQQVWALCGTFVRSMLTMFEITLANWVPPCRLLMDHVSIWYAMFFMFYKLSVGFAVVNVIRAVFIQQTMKVATTDESILAMQKDHQSRRYQNRLKTVFSHIDKSDKGYITVEEFQVAMGSTRVKALMSAIDVEEREAQELFALLDNGNGEVSWDDFMYGMQRIRGTAQSVDIMTLLCMQQKEALRCTTVQQEVLDTLREMRPAHQKHQKHPGAHQGPHACQAS